MRLNEIVHVIGASFAHWLLNPAARLHTRNGPSDHSSAAPVLRWLRSSESHSPRVGQRFLQAWSEGYYLCACPSAKAGGERIGVDASTMEVNAALRTIVRRDSGEGYREMLTRMAKDSGIGTPTAPFWFSWTAIA
jgi:transposase